MIQIFKTILIHADGSTQICFFLFEWLDVLKYLGELPKMVLLLLPPECHVAKWIQLCVCVHVHVWFGKFSPLRHSSSRQVPPKLTQNDTCAALPKPNAYFMQSIKSWACKNRFVRPVARLKRKCWSAGVAWKTMYKIYSLVKLPELIVATWTLMLWLMYKDKGSTLWSFPGLFLYSDSSKVVLH